MDRAAFCKSLEQSGGSNQSFGSGETEERRGTVVWEGKVMCIIQNKCSNLTVVLQTKKEG